MHHTPTNTRVKSLTDLSRSQRLLATLAAKRGEAIEANRQEAKAIEIERKLADLMLSLAGVAR